MAPRKGKKHKDELQAAGEQAQSPDERGDELASSTSADDGDGDDRDDRDDVPAHLSEADKAGPAPAAPPQ